MQDNNNPRDSKTDQILDLLLDALLERQQVKNEATVPIQVAQKVEEEIETAVYALHDDTADGIIASEENKEEEDDVRETAVFIPEKLPSIHLDNMLKKLVIFLAILIILINIPFNRYGTNLARAMPDTQSLVIRDGLVLKGSDEKIYVLENNQKQWITTLDAFTHYGYRWEQVHLVDDAFLDQFENGRSLYLLQKCAQSPHVYALENGEKRWIKDIPTFQANGFVWEDIQFVSCQQLRNMPDGPPIPPDAGDPPQP